MIIFFREKFLNSSIIFENKLERFDEILTDFYAFTARLSTNLTMVVIILLTFFSAVFTGRNTFFQNTFQVGRINFASHDAIFTGLDAHLAVFNANFHASHFLALSGTSGTGFQAIHADINTNFF